MPKALTSLPAEGSEVNLISMEGSIVAGVGTVGNRKPPGGFQPQPSAGASEDDLPSALVKIISIDLTENIKLPPLPEPYSDYYEGKLNLEDWAGAQMSATGPLVKKTLVWPLAMLAPVVSEKKKPEGPTVEVELENQFEFDGLIAFGPVSAISINAVQYQRAVVKQSKTTLLSARFAYVVPSVFVAEKPLEMLFVGCVKVDEAEGGVVLLSLAEELPIVIFGPATCIIGGVEALVPRRTVPGGPRGTGDRGGGTAHRACARHLGVDWGGVR